ncbi:Nn.00g023940.m01.CDS01 [Neocucurbitaria sp. VM-36]
MATREPWTQRLRDHCLVRRLGEPSYQDVSDRRGGRTAWSTVAVVNGTPYAARFWYDGAYIDQAKEDAAEIALRKLTGYTDPSLEPPPASHYRSAISA